MSAVDSPSPFPEPGPVRSDVELNGVEEAMDTDLPAQQPADDPMVLGKLNQFILLSCNEVDIL